MTHFVCLALCAASVSNLCHGQQVWKVNCNGGPGVHFTDLPPAVAAAAPGDTIWVYQVIGSACPAYNAPVINKPLRIAGFTATTGGSGTTGVNVRGQVVVQNLAPGERAIISGLNVADVFLTCAVKALDCQGDVVFDNVTLTSFGGPNVSARVERCSNVVFRGCTFRLGGSPLVVLDSNVLLTTVSLYHADPSPSSPYATTAEGVRVTNSTVTAIGSPIWGADYSATFFYPSRPGAIVDTGLFRVGPGTVLRGGLGSWSPSFGYHILNPSLGAVHLDPRGTIVIPHPVATPVPATIDATYHSWVVANETFGVTVVGPPNGFAVLAFGDWLPNTPTPLGSFSLDPLTAFPVDAVPLSSNGVFSWTLNCPLTAPIAHAYAFQAVTVSPTGNLGLTLASPLTVSWPHGVTP